MLKTSAASFLARWRDCYLLGPIHLSFDRPWNDCGKTAVDLDLNSWRQRRRTRSTLCPAGLLRYYSSSSSPSASSSSSAVARNKQHRRRRHTKNHEPPSQHNAVAAEVKRVDPAVQWSADRRFVGFCVDDTRVWHCGSTVVTRVGDRSHISRLFGHLRCRGEFRRQGRFDRPDGRPRH
jgi:hypothetical protein